MKESRMPLRSPWLQVVPGQALVALALILTLLYGGSFWFIRRVVVGPNEVLVLLKKDGSRSLENDQIIIPRPPDRHDTVAYTAWERTYRDINGILEEVYPPGTYFKFSPFDYEREVIDIKKT